MTDGNRGGVTALDPDIAGSLARELPPEDFGRIVESFELDIGRLADEMAAGTAAGDRMAVHRAAHGLAGAAASVGALALEHAARRGLGREPCPPDLVETVRAAGAEAMRALRALMRGSGCA
ncbi:MAG: Hpt domain-containing protein [Acetobacteraceae bacterium]|nr:Hpt domain-containing protein [Acetobacteraceae bacterium]